MRALSILTALAAAAAAGTEAKIANIYIQPVDASSKKVPAPAPLAEVQYDIADPAGAEVLSFEAPEIPETAELIRVGVYDKAKAAWVASTSVALAANFGKGYKPTVQIAVDAGGEVLGASLRGVRIDAGQTRDFGPAAEVTVSKPGKQPELNKPVVLSPEGKKVVADERTFLQKYWWAIGVGVLLLISGGGGGEGK